MTRSQIQVDTVHYQIDSCKEVSARLKEVPGPDPAHMLERLEEVGREKSNADRPGKHHDDIYWFLLGQPDKASRFAERHESRA